MAWDGKRSGPVVRTPEEAALGYFKKYPGGTVSVFLMAAVSKRAYAAWIGPNGKGMAYREVTEEIARAAPGERQAVRSPHRMSARRLGALGGARQERRER